MVSSRLEHELYIGNFCLGNSCLHSEHESPRRSRGDLETFAAQMRSLSPPLFRSFSLGLGNAQLRDGEFWIEPTQSELHYAFPEVARRWVADQLGVALEEVALVTQLASGLWHILSAFRHPQAGRPAPPLLRRRMLDQSS